MKIKVNNVDLNYEVYGEGYPLILLHGNQEDLTIFDKLIEALQGDFKIYAIDSRNHGKSSHSVDFSYDTMMHDVFQFIRKLEINKPHILGFSDGGCTALKLAIHAPNIIDQMIILGTNYHAKGMIKNARKKMKQLYKKDHSPFIKIMLFEPKIKKKQLKKVETKTLMIVGDKDLIKTKHTLKLHRLLKKSKLVVLENENHDSYIVHNDKIKDLVFDFLKK